ncbi:uncharacterized protein LOC131659195 [Vicia villosa]|uniref:uncharacterized protein LOC131659195 n=1 Tax=Vicia villosa TaxID=3911 RepID=UPI00273BD560|nr:uncharacterized protein LOC131659195 [Vicia villosa]
MKFIIYADEQQGIFKEIMKAVRGQKGGVFFLHGYGSTGKTYMWQTLASALRAKHDIYITVATSGIASLLLPGGRTTQSRFKILVPMLDNLTCNIPYHDVAADLLRHAKLIIWNEALMANKWCFEALDKTLKDLMSVARNSNYVFGGKVVVFGGDFRQILPVILRGSRLDIIARNHKRFLHLALCQEEGRLGGPNDGTTEIDFPPDFLDNYRDYNYMKNMAILASTIDMVDKINDHVLALMPGDLRDYYSSDAVDHSEIHDKDMLDVLTPEFLSSLKNSRLPNHHIKLNIDTPIMLMRNIDQSEGLCNGTRLISPWPFKLSRRQFPVIVSYSTMINKSQGQSLDWVGLYIPRDVFTHGQIYVDLSRVTSKQGIKILVHDDNGTAKNSTANVVYKEVFNNA